MGPGDSRTGQEGRPAGAQGSAAAPRRVLVVDDQLFFLTMARNILTAKGYEVHTAGGGAEGLQAARAVRPHAILLDVEMPGMDGFEACRRLKANPATAAIPVVFLTATLDPKLNQRAFQAGAEATVLKSVSGERILNMLHVVLGTQRAGEPAAVPDRRQAILP